MSRTKIKQIPYLNEWIITDTAKKSLMKINNRAIGFIYKITFNDGQYYIGQKTIKKSYSDLGSDHKYYMSSSDKVHEKIDELFNEEPGLLKTITREILIYADSKINLNYAEAAYQISHNVLTDSNCLNENILNKFFKSRYSNNRYIPNVTIEIE